QCSHTRIRWSGIRHVLRRSVPRTDGSQRTPGGILPPSGRCQLCARRTIVAMSDMTSGLRIGQVAERTGLSIHTLRLYEREGLLVGPVRRLPNGHRVYGEWDVEWLSVCAKFRASGMPLADIRRYAELLRRGPGTEAERLRLLREHREALLRR